MGWRGALALLVAMGFEVGCATPGPIVRLVPTSSDVVWVSGRASMVKEEGGIRVAAAFEHQDGENLGLRVEIENGAGERLEVDPREFTFTRCQEMGADKCGPTKRIIDPEAALARLDERQSREVADATNSQAFLGTLVILSAATDLAAIGSGHADRHTGDATLTSVGAKDRDAAARNTSFASLAVQQQVWSNEALRRSSLFPGQGAGGRVFIPMDLDARIVWLHVRTGGHVFSFPFRQTVTRPAVMTAAS